jgi:hypothetical protein
MSAQKSQAWTPARKCPCRDGRIRPSRRAKRVDQPQTPEQAFRPASKAAKTARASAPEANTTIENHPPPLYKFTTDQVPDTPPTPGPTAQPRGPTIIAAGLLLAALAVVVLYTSRRAFLSPVAMVVVAAIGVMALLLQRRLRPDLRSDPQSATQPSTAPAPPTRTPLRLNAAGVVFAIAAVFADVLHLNPALMLMTALAAVIAFAISAVIVLKALRQPRL